MMTVTNSAAKKATRPATRPFGVQWYWMFEPTTATAVANWMIFSMGSTCHAL